jgi:hypothetical protein
MASSYDVHSSPWYKWYINCSFHDLFLKYTVQSNNSSCRSVLTPKDLVSPLLIGCLPDEKKMKRDMTTNGVTLDFIAILYRKKKKCTTNVCYHTHYGQITQKKLNSILFVVSNDLEIIYEHSRLWPFNKHLLYTFFFTIQNCNKI